MLIFSILGELGQKILSNSVFSCSVFPCRHGEIFTRREILLPEEASSAHENVWSITVFPNLFVSKPSQLFTFADYASLSPIVLLLESSGRSQHFLLEKQSVPCDTSVEIGCTEMIKLSNITSIWNTLSCFSGFYLFHEVETDEVCSFPSEFGDIHGILHGILPFSNIEV